MPKPKTTPKERVSGIGGIFFRSHDPAALSAWYEKHLGVESKDGAADFVWRDHENPKQTGRTVWSIFPKETDYFGSPKPAFMINYRVSNLERMLAQLRRARVKVEKVEECDYGRFAWVTDPEGNRVELWEPMTVES